MVQPRMVSLQSHRIAPPNPKQLEKADETSANDENEVRREDQEKINRFSRLHQRETVLEEQLKGKQVSKRQI